MAILDMEWADTLRKDDDHFDTGMLSGQGRHIGVTGRLRRGG